MQSVGTGLCSSHFLCGGREGGGDEQGLTADGLRIDLRFELFIHNALMCRMHVNHNQTLFVFCQDVNAVQLGNGFAQGPAVRAGCDSFVVRRC